MSDTPTGTHPGATTGHSGPEPGEPPRALYVYALLPDPGEALPDTVTGIDGRPLRLVGDGPGGPVALVHATAPAPYQGPDEDVRRWIVEHDRAVDAAWQLTGAVLPMTFNVLVRPEEGRSAEQRLLSWLAERRDELTARLDELAGHAELQVEITLDREAAAVSNERARSLMADMAESSPGVRRLLAKRLEMARREASEQLADTLYADARRRLAAVSEDLQDRRRAVRDPGETDVLSVSLLVRQDGIETVGRVLAEIQDEQPAVRIRFLGPWPPYSFADLGHGPGGAEEAPPGRAVPGLRT
ncbi:GvpL/GvpF family gas vesicle protein [Streptomyces xinghaiensis]|uniref:GvpL/GvpF family gas vesicle protein n=1 Tax=Streptomyces xinghaiensis TaxID=1038928 RepID=UPI0003007CD3|nr:GvpL/GvpF family gas vesicle protein [Streptomyces xinghaiensis]MZE78304.1 gvpL 2 [Streptomyces sp. SID5475]